MTKLLVQLNDIRDYGVAYQAKAEILMLDNWQEISEIDFYLKQCTDYSPEIWLYFSKFAVLEKNIKNIPTNYKLVLPVNEAERLTRLDVYKKLPLIFLADLDSLPLHQKIQEFKEKKLKTLLISSNNKESQLLNAKRITEIGAFFQMLKQEKIKSGIIGTIQAPDIPRLLPFFPHYIGCKAEQPVVKGYFGDEETTKLIRAMIPSYSQDEKKQTGVMNENLDKLGTDRIIIEDFVLPMEIGAYQHEYGHKQNVRFNIKVDIKRLSNNLEDMRHIFSYDIILDGIRNIISQGHIVLVETLAERVAAFILAYPRVKKVKVKVEKLELGPKAVGIEIKRKNSKNSD